MLLLSYIHRFFLMACVAGLLFILTMSNTEHHSDESLPEIEVELLVDESIQKTPIDENNEVQTSENIQAQSVSAATSIEKESSVDKAKASPPIEEQISQSSLLISSEQNNADSTVDSDDGILIRGQIVAIKQFIIWLQKRGGKVIVDDGGFDHLQMLNQNSLSVSAISKEDLSRLAASHVLRQGTVIELNEVKKYNTKLNHSSRRLLYAWPLKDWRLIDAQVRSGFPEQKTVFVQYRVANSGLQVVAANKVVASL